MTANTHTPGANPLQAPSQDMRNLRRIMGVRPVGFQGADRD